jgi:hypothetical protein
MQEYKNNFERNIFILQLKSQQNDYYENENNMSIELNESSILYEYLDDNMLLD